MIIKTKMIAETAKQSKAHSPAMETLILFLLLTVADIAIGILTIPAFMVYIYSDKQLLEMSMYGNADFNMMLDRVVELFNALPEWINIFTLFLNVVSIAIIIVYCKFIEKRTASSMGIRKGHVFGEYAIGFFIGLIMMSLVFAALCLSGIIVIEGINKVSFFIIVLYLLAYIIQGMSEELLVRGYYMTSLTKSTRISTALVMSSMIFAFLHFGNNGLSAIALVNLVMFGLFAGIYLIKRGNIWGISGLHSAWNFSQGVLFGFSVSGMGKTTSVLNIGVKDGYDTLTGGAFGPEGGLFVTLILFLSIGAVLVLKPNKNEIADVGLEKDGLEN